MKLRLLLAVLLLPVTFLFAQEQLDTVYLMSGKTVEGVVKDTSNEKLKILIPTKGGGYKADFIEQELIFSVKYKTGAERVFYVQDTLFGNYYSPNQVRYFLQGERDARKYYRCPMWVGGGFVAGFAGGYTNNVLGLVIPFGYSMGTLAFHVKVRRGSIADPMNLQYSETYLMGYEKVARQRRVMRSLVTGALGFAAGIVVRSVVNNNGQN